MQVTFDLPDDVVAQLSPFEDKLAQILELGLRELNAIAHETIVGLLGFVASNATGSATQGCPNLRDR